MRKEKPAEQPTTVTPLEAQLAIRQAAAELGARIPSTLEEVNTFLESTDISSVRRISTAKALERLREGHRPEEDIPEIPIEASIIEDFAMAARNGTELTEDVKNLMAADRKKAEEDQSSNA